MRRCGNAVFHPRHRCRARAQYDERPGGQVQWSETVYHQEDEEHRLMPVKTNSYVDDE